MAVNIFDKYGIKEVANVYFEALEDDPKSNVYKGDIVLFLDTLKVSTIETTAETTDATGGWGNPKLISWDYGKEITITLEDALISLESLRFMLGGAIHRGTSEKDQVTVRHTEEVVCGPKGVVPKPTDHITDAEYTVVATTDAPVRVINLTTGARTQLTSGTIDGTNVINFVNEAMLGTTTTTTGVGDNATTTTTPVSVPTKQGDRLRIFWTETYNKAADAEKAVEVTISPDTFPGTYRVVGDTFMRSQATGKDEAFQFVIGKAKVQSNVTITLEAEGDPSTFEMTLTVLRSDNERGEKEMMKLIRYGTAAADAASDGNDKGSLTTPTTTVDGQGDNQGGQGDNQGGQSGS